MLKRIATSWLPWLASIFVAFSALAIPFALVTRYSARGTFATDNLIVHQTSTLTGRTAIQSESFAPADVIGQLPFQTILNDWSPAGLQTHTPLVVTASDNTGTVITGIDSTNIAVGDIRTICNLNGPSDDAVVVLTNLDPRSLAANRVMTPDSNIHGLGTSVADFMIGPGACRDIQYTNPDSLDLTFFAWVVHDGDRRFNTVLAQAFQTYPGIHPVAITGTVNNYAPVDNSPYVCNPGAVPCSEAGDNGTFASNSLVFLQTVDATGATITGLQYTTGQPDTIGPIKIIYNFGPGPITFTNDDAGSSALNQIGITTGGNNQANIVLGAGRPPLVLFHARDTGRWLPLNHRDYLFDERDITAGAGINVTGGSPSTTDAIDVTVAKGVRLGLGVTLPFVFAQTNDFATSSIAEVGTSLTVSGGAFTGGALAHICDGRAPTSVSSGALLAGSTNCKGRITGIGATTVTLTFAGGASNSSECSLTANGGTPFFLTVGTPSTTAPVFDCFDAAGAPANCPDISYSCWWH